MTVGDEVVKILVIKMDHLGDVLWAFPAAGAVAASMPEAELHLLCTPYAEDAGRRMPGISRVFKYNAAWGKKEKDEVVRRLKEQKYDIALVMGPADKVNYLAYLSGARKRIGYYLAGKPLVYLADLLFMTQRIPHPADMAQREGKPLPHEVEALCSLVKHIGAEPPEKPVIEFPVTDEELKTACEIKKSLGKDKPLAVIQLCSKAFGYGWHGDNFLKLAFDIKNSLPGYAWAVSAGPLEEKCLPEYRAKLEKNGIEIISGLSLGQMAALLSVTGMFVSWDTGVVHLALAMGTPVLDVFPWKNFDYCSQRWGPWKGRSRIVVQSSPVLDERTVGKIINQLKDFAEEQGGSPVGF
ncbi:MAG: hypothetical protein M1269_05775 [Chloroflexi bacterium]|nr:hypothetical protein [Chloroflexota bacterium]